MEVSDADIPNYANIKGTQTGDHTVSIEQIVEKPAVCEKFSNRAVIGRYVVESDIYDIIRTTPPSQSGEVYFTDALGALAKQDRLVGCLFTGKRYDAGNKLEYLEANIEYALRDPSLGDGVRSYIKSLAKKLENRE